MNTLTLRERLAHDYLRGFAAGEVATNTPMTHLPDIIAAAYKWADAFLAAREPAPEQQPPQEACERFDCAGIDEGCGDHLDPHASTRCGEWDHRCTCGLSYSQHPAQQPSPPAAEPVAWSTRRRGEQGLWGLYSEPPVTRGDDAEVVPLYAAPPAPREAKAPDAVWVMRDPHDGGSPVIEPVSHAEKVRLMRGRDRVTLHVSVEE